MKTKYDPIKKNKTHNSVPALARMLSTFPSRATYIAAVGFGIAASHYAPLATGWAGVQDESATGYYRLGDHLLYFTDTELAASRGDGLPETCRLEDGTVVPLKEGTTTDLFGGAISIVVGTRGDDTIDLREHGNSAIVFGGPGDDDLRGSEYDDVLHGSWGQDRISGGSGNDVISLATVFDPGEPRDLSQNILQVAQGGEGDDYLFGGLEDTRMEGGPGDDVVQGAGQNDRLWGGPGDDAIYGGVGKDRLYGGPGDDVLHGGDHEDRLYGESGRDLLIGTDNTRDEIIDGGSSFSRFAADDHAFIDSLDESVLVGVEVFTTVAPLRRVLFAATDASDENGARLYQIDPDTGACEGMTFVAGTTEITALAVSPLNGELWGIVTWSDTPTQKSLVRIAPQNGSIEEAYDLNLAVVDITFEGTGRLMGLVEMEGERAEAAEINVTDGWITYLGKLIHGGTPLYLVYDAPEGYLFAVLEEEGESHLNNFEPFNLMTNYVAPYSEEDGSEPEGGPLTWDSDRNRMLEVNPVDGTIHERARRYAEGHILLDAHGRELVAKDEAGRPLTGVTAVAMPQSDAR